MADTDDSRLINWAAYGAWQMYNTPRGFLVRVQDTAVTTSVVKRAHDRNIHLEVFGTGKNKVVGYVLRVDGTPLSLLSSYSLGLFYSDHTDTAPRRIESVLYHDQNVRLLGFGPEATRDYLWVLRKR